MLFWRIFVFLGVVLLGCNDIKKNSPAELSNKQEYSIIQSVEYEYRNVRHEKEYIIFRDALNTKKTLVAFPVKDKNHGYVVILASSCSSPKVKYLPEKDFMVSPSTLEIVFSEVSFSDEVRSFLLSHSRAL
jgi:hypothetical protein